MKHYTAAWPDLGPEFGGFLTIFMTKNYLKNKNNMGQCHLTQNPKFVVKFQFSMVNRTCGSYVATKT